MSFLEGLLGREQRFRKGTTQHPSNFISWLAGDDAYAGVSVTEGNSLQYSAVYAAVRIISESVAQLPLKLFRRTDTGKELADAELQHRLLHDQPNPETTSFRFRETLQSHLLTWGNAYAEIEMGPRGETLGLWQRRPDRVEVQRRESDLELIYVFRRRDGGEDVLDSSQVLHVPGLSFNGLVGFSPIRLAREAIGLGMGLERYGASLFGHGAVPGLIVKHPQKLTAETQERLRTSIERVHKGPDRAGKTMILDEAMDVTQIGLPNDEAEFLATRTFQVQEVARIYNIPPHLLRDLTKSSFSNIEEQDREFLKITLLPWLKRWEGELNRKVLTTRQREAGLFFEFSVDGFLRANFSQRMEGHRAAVMGSWMTPNQVRALENMNPDPNLDFYLIPQNMSLLKPDGSIVVPGGNGGAPPGQEQDRALPPADVEKRQRQERSVESRWRLQDIFRSLLEQAAERTVTAEVKAIRREAKKIPDGTRRDFLSFLEGFYFDTHPSFLRSVLGPVLLAYMRAVSQEALVEVEADTEEFDGRLQEFHTEYESTFSTRQSAESRRELTALVEESVERVAAAEAVEERLEKWQAEKAAVMANREATQAGSAIALTAYAFAGVATLRWVWNGGDCPLCSRMHGRIVQTGQPFARPGESVGDPTETTPLVVKQVHSHPPLHSGCKCTVASAV